jgi:uncharacterized protein (TIGR02757 family)
LEFLYAYPNLADREIVGFIAASLAYGRVKQILRSVATVLETIGESPRQYLDNVSTGSLKRAFRGFKHRFTTEEELISLLRGMRRVFSRYGTLEACFMSAYEENAEDVLPGLSYLVDQLSIPTESQYNTLLPSPEKGSACKRLNLFLRWMVRKDRVDPGGWQQICPSKLIVPLDTHMHRIAIRLGMTSRKSPGMCTAIEVTKAFRGIDHADPVRYDFPLTRLGIRTDTDMALIEQIC